MKILYLFYVVKLSANAKAGKFLDLTAQERPIAEICSRAVANVLGDLGNANSPYADTLLGAVRKLGLILPLI